MFRFHTLASDSELQIVKFALEEIVTRTLIPS